MKNAIEKWLDNYVPNWKELHFLVAVSGGRDSVVLATVLKSLGVQISIAHCNYKLRGTESDADEQFVRLFGNKLNVPYHVTHFETQKILDTDGGNLQEVARQLRYNWFSDVLKEHQLDYICIGSHLNDSAETLFMNLMRGSGIKGLRGILPVRGKVLRPLIETSRIEIDSYITENNLEYREDSTNASSKYERNQWRNVIIPQIKELYPHFDNAIKTSIGNLHFSEQLVVREIERLRKHLIIQQGDKWLISKPLLKELQPLNYYLFEALRPFQFNSATVNDICNTDFSSVGKQFFSPSYVLTIDRNYLILVTNETDKTNIETTRKISLGDSKIKRPIELNFSFLDAETDVDSSPKKAYLDIDKLNFPLTLRKWENGDRFQPFGMKRKKKVSDFLIDEKVSLPEKNKQFVLLSNSEIVWVIGRRIDNRFAVKESTKKIYFVEQLND